MQPVCDMGGDSAQAIGRASRPPLGCWEFPLSRAEKVHLLLDLYSMEVQACHLEVAKLKASDSSSSGCSRRTSASSGQATSLEGLEVARKSQATFGREAPRRRADVKPRQPWEDQIIGVCQGCGGRQFLVTSCKGCKAAYCSAACLTASFRLHRRGCAFERD
ncbi:unnamed protein product [Effrenium voratum]|nr:unnamed protein product [Effrenium voratum]